MKGTVGDSEEKDPLRKAGGWEWGPLVIKRLGWTPDSPSPCVSARQQPGLTAVQQLVLHAVAL